MIPPSLRSILVGMAALSRAEYEATGWQAWLNQTCQRMITFAKLLHQLPRVSLPQRFPVLAEFLCPVAGHPSPSSVNFKAFDRRIQLKLGKLSAKVFFKRATFRRLGLNSKNWKDILRFERYDLTFAELHPQKVHGFQFFPSHRICKQFGNILETCLKTCKTLRRVKRMSVNSTYSSLCCMDLGLGFTNC
jgi:hypothetical protein